MQPAAPTSLAVLVDNARTAIAAGRDAGIETPALLVSEADFEAVKWTKRREVAHDFPVRLLGVDILPRSGLEVGSVRLALDSELGEQ